MLNTQANLTSCDDFYEALLNAHQGLSTAQSHAMNARLVLLLSNHIGDLTVLKDALRLARSGQAALAADAGEAGAPLSPVAPSRAAQ
jgi:hypothetical protein